MYIYGHKLQGLNDLSLKIRVITLNACSAAEK